MGMRSQRWRLVNVEVPTKSGESGAKALMVDVIARKTDLAGTGIGRHLYSAYADSGAALPCDKPLI
jgi:hypothetical protein